MTGRSASESGLHDEPCGIGNINQEEENAFQPRNFPAGAHDRQQQDRTEKHDAEVDIAERRIPERGDQRSDAEDCEDVEDVRADHVADGDILFAADGGDDRGRQLRQAGADCDQGEADHGVADLQQPGEKYGAGEEELRAEDQEREPGDGQEDGGGEAHCLGISGGDGFPRLLDDGGVDGRFALRLPHAPGRIEDDRREKDCAVDAADAVPGQVEYGQHGGGQQHDRRVELEQMRVDPERGDDGAESEDQRDIADIRADHVAETDVGVARDGGVDADHQFRRAGGEGDEREPDDQRGDAASLRDAHAAAHEKFRAVIEGGDAGGAVEQVQNRLHETPPGSVSCFSGIWKNSPFL